MKQCIYEVLIFKAISILERTPRVVRNLLYTLYDDWINALEWLGTMSTYGKTI